LDQECPHILVIDDDVRLGGLLKAYLEQYQFRVTTFADAEIALEWYLSGAAQVDLIVSDIMMPKLDGLSLLQQVRSESQVPFLFLSARGEVSDKVLGLTIGADDYLSKPFEPRELEARCRALLRRKHQPKNQNNESDTGLTMDFGSHQVFVESQEVIFTSTEFELLELLCRNKGTVVSRDQIMEKVRGIEWESYNRSVDMLVSKVRTKLGCDSKSPKYIRTIRGTGYLWIGDYRLRKPRVV
jgi:DNA-binding response OmpR family regulator